MRVFDEVGTCGECGEVRTLDLGLSGFLGFAVCVFCSGSIVEGHGGSPRQVGLLSPAFTFRQESGEWRFLFVVERAGTVPLDAWIPPSERGKALVVTVSVESLRYAVDDYLWQFMADSLTDAEWRCLEYVREVSRL